MTLAEFQNSLGKSNPPDNLTAYCQSLWYDAKGDWNKAHEIIQDLEDQTAAWVHAYLHRKEGDIGNADYWYRRAGKKRPDLSLEEEWKIMANSLL